MSISPVKLFSGVKTSLKNNAKKISPKKVIASQAKEVAAEVAKKAGKGVSKTLYTAVGFILGVTGFGLPATMIIQSYSNQLPPQEEKTDLVTA